jgi:predicted nucleotidyltransferase
MAPRTDLHSVIEMVTRYLDAIKKLNIPFDSAYLYGSYSKGLAHQESDIDVAIIAPDWQPDIIESQIRLMMAAADIDLRIEPYPIRNADFNESNPLAHEILSHGIKIV